MEQQLDLWLSQYGYFGIIAALIGGIIGLPVPDEFLMTFVGYNVAQGRMIYIFALLSAVMGSIVGITVSYVLGSKLGLPFLRKFGPKMGITTEKVDNTHRLFNKFGAFLLFIGYFIPGVRHLTAYLAGISEFSLRKFALYAYPGACLWVFTFITLGWKLGERWREVEHYVHRYMPYLFLFATCLLLILVYMKFTKRTSS